MGIVKAAAKTEFHRSVRRTVRKLCAQQHATTTAQLSDALAQKDVLLREKGVVKTPGHMNKFKIKVARIETTGRDEQNEQVCVTFQLDRRLTSFQVPVLLGINDFDDTEMVQAARNALHLIFAELASQSLEWKFNRKRREAAFEHKHAPKIMIIREKACNWRNLKYNGRRP